MLDRTTEWGKHANERLHSDLIGWLTTVGVNGRPYTVPVWFLWEEGETILIFSQPNKQKVKNLQHNPRITLALDESKKGEDVVIVEGTAELLPEPAIELMTSVYIDKYKDGLKDLGWTAEAMAANFSLSIRITPTKIRSWG